MKTRKGQRPPRVFHCKRGWFVRFKGYSYYFGSTRIAEREALNSVDRISRDVLPGKFMGEKEPMPRLTIPRPTPPAARLNAGNIRAHIPPRIVVV